MTLIQNEDNKCPTTKQVNDALESMGGVQTLVLTTYNLINTDRSSPLEVNSSDQAVMDTVKSNVEKNIPFQLLYYGVTGGISSVQLLPVSLYGISLANMFTLYVNVNQGGLQHFSLNKGSNQKWTASTLSNS